MRVLYVEDNRLNALLFEQALKLLPALELRIAENGAQALRDAAHWQPQVLVLDSHLPDTDGFALLQQLRLLPGLAEVPAFMCSADAQPQDMRRARELGFRDYWAKPIEIDQVLAELRRCETAPR